MSDGKFHYNLDNLEQFDKVIEKIKEEKNPYESLRQTDKLLKAKTFEDLLKVYDSIDNVLIHEFDTLRNEKSRLSIAHACIIFRSAIEAQLQKEEKKLGLNYNGAETHGIKLKDGNRFRLSVEKRLAMIFGEKASDRIYDWYSCLSEADHGDVVGFTDMTKWTEEKVKGLYNNLLVICPKIIDFVENHIPVHFRKIILPSEPLCKDYSSWAVVRPNENELHNDIENLHKTKEDLVDKKTQKPSYPNGDLFSVKDLSKKELTAQEIYKFCRPNIVQVIASHSTGTGFFIGNGYIITNQHVVGQSESVYCINEKNDKLSAKVLKTLYKYDLALLKLISDCSNRHLSLKFSEKDCEIGQKIYVIGNSLGEGICLLDGIISDLGRDVDVRGGHKIINSIMFSAPIVGGNSGGPLLNVFGEVIGVVSASCDNSTAMNYAIPISKVKEFIK